MISTIKTVLEAPHTCINDNYNTKVWSVGEDWTEMELDHIFIKIFRDTTIRVLPKYCQNHIWYISRGSLT
jgi:hypothetical protein